MNLRFYVLCTAALLVLGVSALPTSGVPFLADSNITATIHGATYAWDTLEPLNDTVISINSNPSQSIVAKNGTYSFELGPGDYIITARYYRNKTVIYSKQTTLKIEDEGNYVFDLLLYPASENPATEAIEDRMDNANSASPAEKTRTDSFTRTDSSTLSYLPVALIFLFLLGGSYRLSRKHKKMKRNSSQAGKFNTPRLLAKAFGRSTGSDVRPKFGNIGEAASTIEPVIKPVIETADNSQIETALKQPPLSADLREILDVIRGHRGRITQKDLRSRLEYSEVKVSLLLSELEKRGLIKKSKHGRENIVILTDKEQR
ncbi:helix-turn-helix transcriptional regulator [Methanosarcina sp.]|uniref:helix-turn-helix transcriptional regulator n=1 Tax=Methanosarcina sp. TaxID=2213 RepID=UPI003C70CE63